MSLELLKPKEITIPDMEGTLRTYILSRMDFITAREIMAKYPLSALPKVGDYSINEETMMKLMSFVGVQTGAIVQRLETRAMINNHIPDFETGAKLELAMIDYNTSFFRDGRISNSFQGFVQKILVSISKTLMDSQDASSQTDKPPSTN